MFWSSVRMWSLLSLWVLIAQAGSLSAMECGEVKGGTIRVLADDTAGKLGLLTTRELFIKDVAKGTCRTIQSDDGTSMRAAALARTGELLVYGTLLTQGTSSSALILRDLKADDQKRFTLASAIEDIFFTYGSNHAVVITRQNPVLLPLHGEPIEFGTSPLKKSEKYLAGDLDLHNRILLATDASGTYALRLYALKSEGAGLKVQQGAEADLKERPLAVRASRDGSRIALVSEASGSAVSVALRSDTDLSIVESYGEFSRGQGVIDVAWTRDGALYLQTLENGLVHVVRISPASGDGLKDYFTKDWSTPYSRPAERPSAVQLLTTHYVDEAITMKKNKFTDAAIAESLFNEAKKDARAGASEGVFGSMVIPASDKARMKQAEFSEDFIGKMEGQDERVTVGLAGVWMNETAELVSAAMLRIAPLPKSFYTPRRSFFSPGSWWPSGLIDIRNWDINVGYSTSARTSKDPNSTDKKNFILIGASFELNPAALLNFGVAVPPGDVKGTQKQLYIGLTVDQTIFKQLGWIK